MTGAGGAGAEAFVALTSTNPARIYGLERKGDIAQGFDADLTIWDPTRQVTYGADDLHDNAGYNPWQGHTVTGWPETVILRGEVLVEGGACVGHPGQGHAIPRPTLGTRAGV